MTGLMRTCLAAAIATSMMAAGCGNGNGVNPGMAPAITSTPPTTATLGVPFNYTVTADGMTPIGFVLVNGPAGFMVHPTSGVVTWTPSAAGTVSVEISANNLAGMDTQSFDVEVEDLSAPEITSEPPTEATVGAPYAYDPEVVAQEDITWSATVAPDGLSIDPDTGAVRWTPTSEQAGDQDVTIVATEVESGRSDAQSFTVTVEDTGGPAVITSTPPTNVYAGETFTYAATASGAPTIRWTVETPSSGTPAEGVGIVTDPAQGDAVDVQWDTSGTAPGAYSVALQVFNDLGEPSLQEFEVTVDPRPPVPEIDLVTVAPPATVFVGSVYTYDVNVTSESESDDLVWSLGATVPDELAITIDPDSGEVSFTASTANGEMEYSYVVRVQNVLGESDEETITVDAVFPPETPILTVTPDTAFTVLAGESFPGASASATGIPAPTLSIDGTLPDFIDFDPLTGLLSASATKPAPENGDIGDYAFDVVASNSEGSDRQTIDVSVLAAPPSVDSVTPAAGRRQSDVPIIVRGSGFVSEASPTIRLELGAYSETLTTSYVDDSTLTATVPIDESRPSGVYDLVVDQGSETILAKRFTVTEGAGTILTGLVGVDITLRAIDSPHVVTGDLRIENGATLTVEPGAVVMLRGNTNLRIDVGVNGAGALVADGGEPGVGDQIVFTRFQDVAGPVPSGHYRGLRYGSNVITASNVLKNAVVEFGGRVNTDANRGAIEVLSGSAPVIVDSVIRESLNYGLYAQSGAGSDSVLWFDRNELSANGRSPISIGSDDVGRLGANLELTGNVLDRVYVRGSWVTGPDETWVNYGVPYYMTADLAVRNGGSMSIEPGTEMRFAANRRIIVATNSEPGTLIASGTPEAPIRMVPDTGTWNGIYLDNATQAGTVLRNVRLEGIGTSVNGAVRVDNPVTPGDRIVIVENCLFQSDEVGSTGFYLSSSAGLSSFANNVLDVDGISVSAAMAGIDDLLGPSNTYESPVVVRGSTVTGQNVTWTKPLASDGAVQPIRPTSSIAVTDGSLSIEAGNRIEMPINGTLTMTDSQLTVTGTEAEPVLFEPVEGADYWNRIRLRGAGSTGASSIAHAVLQSAGSSPGTAPGTSRAAMTMEARNGVPATPSISHTMILDSNGYGMVFGDTTHCGGGCDDNVIAGSAYSAVRMHGNYVGRFGTGNTLAGNNTTGTLGHEGFWVVGDVIDTSATWPANDVPYLAHGDFEVRQASPVDPVPVLTIDPGSELRFSSDRRLRIGEGNDGILVAQGSAEAPITFTSMDPAGSVFWRGIDFNQGSDGSVLDHVVVSYGGRSNNSGNVNFRIGSVVTIGAVSFTHSEDYAAVINTGSAPLFTDPPSSREYLLNGQESIPGPGDPTFDCVRDVAAGTCTQL